METEIEIRTKEAVTHSTVKGRLADMLMGALISGKQAKFSKEKTFINKGTFQILDIIEDCKFLVNSGVTIYLLKGSYIKIITKKDND